MIITKFIEQEKIPNEEKSKKIEELILKCSNLDQTGIDYALYKKCQKIMDFTVGFYEADSIRALDPKTFTSNRFNYWTNVFKSSEKPFAGYGALGDRFLIGENSHNIFVYSYASGGLVSMLLILAIIIRYTYICILIVFFEKIKWSKQNFYLFCGIFTLSFLIYRGLGENGFGVFSIDLLVFLICATICEKYHKQKKI
tara:strand:- start:105 stop:698 length:594 start_codon:yes stop_codon:yes gene_type:complete